MTVNLNFKTGQIWS